MTNILCILFAVISSLNWLPYLNDMNQKPTIRRGSDFNDWSGKDESRTRMTSIDEINVRSRFHERVHIVVLKQRDHIHQNMANLKIS